MVLNPRAALGEKGDDSQKQAEVDPRSKFGVNKPEPKVESKSEPKTDPKSEPKADPKPEVKSEPKPNAESGAKKP